MPGSGKPQTLGEKVPWEKRCQVPFPFALAWTPAFSGVTTTFAGLGGPKGERAPARTHRRDEATLREAQGGPFGVAQGR
jgi:hypothetical protein